MSQAPASPIEILLVEDNPGDVELMLEAFADSKLQNTIHVVGDGEAALDFLYRRGRYAEAVRPDIVLLDIHIPKIDGKDVLARVKGDPKLQGIPVVMLISFDAEAEVLNTYTLHANCFITKPVSFEKFLQAARSVEHFRFSVVKLPESRQMAA